MMKVAIIGSGMSGTTVANKIKSHCDVTIFEKSRGVSGRMATRRANGYVFDHGTQFFLARSNEFKDYINPLIEKKIIQTWHGRFVEINKNIITHSRNWNNEKPHYVGTPNMNSIIKELGKDLNIKNNTEIISITKKNNRWDLLDKNGNVFIDFDWVILSMPTQQARNLVSKEISFYSNINCINMESCFSLMIGFKEKINLLYDVALVKNMDVSWISVNSTKPDRGINQCLLVHSTNKWATKNIDNKKEDVIDYISNQTSNIIGFNTNKADHIDVHGWRYANIKKQKGASHYIDVDSQIGICGDSFIQGRVEAAFTSANELSKNLYKFIN